MDGFIKGWNRLSNARLEEKLSRLWTSKQLENERKFSKMRKVHEKEVRQLEKMSENQGEGTKRQLDPRALLKYEYASAPTKAKQIGHILGGLTSSYLDTFEGLDEIEKIIGARKSSHASFDKIEKKTDQNAEKSLKIKSNRKNQPATSILEDFKIAVRPQTPTIDEDTDTDVFQAALIIQKTVRGRADQIRMQRELKLNQDLIQELREQYPITPGEQSKGSTQRSENEDEQLQAEDRIEEFLSRIESDTLGKMIDYLSFELTHSVITPRAQDILELDNMERDKRREEKQNQLYSQILQVTRSTVNLYLDQLLLSTVYKAGDISSLFVKYFLGFR